LLILSKRLCLYKETAALIRSIGRFAFVLALASSCHLARAQETFTPIPPESAAKYKFNFPRNFFASPEAEKGARVRLEALFKGIESLKGKVAASPDNLLRALRLSDQLQSEFMRHYIYLYLRYATNTKNDTAREEQQKLGSELDNRVAFLQQELMRIDESTLSRYMSARPAIKPYTFVIESARRLRPHTLSLKEEELIGATYLLMADWQGQLYQRGLDRTSFGKVTTPQGELDVFKQENTLRNSPDRAVREAGFKKMYDGLAAQRDLYAFAMTRLVRSRDTVSKLRRYTSYPNEVHFGLYLKTPEVKGLFERIAQAADFNKRYQKLRADHIKKISGIDDVHVYDMTVIPPGLQRPRFTIDEARNVIDETLTPFGTEYNQELAALLNPANGRLDLVPSDNRVPGAFAWGFPGSQTSIFYSFNYEGFYDDVSALIHESGHAVHFQLMGNNHVLPTYTNGPNYFTESFAMFNELLLADRLYKKETDPLRKTFFLERFLTQAMSVYGITRQAALEQAMYDGVERGTLKTPEDFDKLTIDLGRRYSIWYDKDPELKNDWISVHHYFDSPMYYVNYVYANFLALKYFELYARDPKAFIPKYLELVRNGFNAPPDALLKRFLNIDLRDPKLVADTIGILESRVKDLQALYAGS
jgi:oligoendopeptidase F